MTYKSTHAKYKEFKATHPDAVVFVRLDVDHYATFDDDADTCTMELGLGECNMKAFPADFTVLKMPIFSIDGYVAKLVEKGYAVAMCDSFGTRRRE